MKLREDGITGLRWESYLAEPHWIDPAARPFEWYKQYVVQGAREHGLDPEYIEGIEEVVADRDPDRERARGNRA